MSHTGPCRLSLIRMIPSLKSISSRRMEGRILICPKSRQWGAKASALDRRDRKATRNFFHPLLRGLPFRLGHGLVPSGAQIMWPRFRFVYCSTPDQTYRYFSLTLFHAPTTRQYDTKSQVCFCLAKMGAQCPDSMRDIARLVMLIVEVPLCYVPVLCPYVSYYFHC